MPDILERPAARRAYTPPMKALSNSARLDALLTTCQIVTSSFPTGSFCHSYGLEKLIAAGVASDAAAVEKICRAWLRFSLCTLDGVAAAHAYRVARTGDVARLADINRRIACMRLTREARQASLLTGRALATAASSVIASPVLAEFRAYADGSAEGCQQPVIFGALMAAAGLDEDEGVAMFLQTSFTSLVGVGARLVPLGQSEVQAILTRARDLIVDCARICQSRSLDQMSAAATQLEIASMQHERQEARLCMS
ncbi:MAG: urease accessory protein UreF [Parvibaculaceae bacterium]